MTKSIATLVLLIAGLGAAYAQAPAGATGECKDGTYTTQESKKGACAGHGGVKSWTGASSSKMAAPAASSSMAAPATAAAASNPAMSSDKMSSDKTSSNQPAAVAAPGGGPGKVWANDSSKVYHCPGDRWYGKSKHGEYMSEADAKSKGYKPDHGKACSS